MPQQILKMTLLRLWYAIRFSPSYYKLSHFPKFYRQLSLSGFRLRDTSTSFKPFFIMACGRSGNTLLRAMLCNNISISIPPESYVLGDVYDKFRIFNHLKWETLVKLVLGEFEAHENFKDWNANLQPLYAKLFTIPKKSRTLDTIIDAIYTHYTSVFFPEAILWGDKTPENNLWMPKIKKIFPEAKYIFLYRDGRDATASLVKAGILDDLEKACLYWNLNMKLSEDFLRKIPSQQFMSLRYEDLVSNPEIEIKKVCEFLGVVFEEAMLHPYTLYDQLGDVPAHRHHENVGKPISTQSVGKWKREFSKKEQELAERMMYSYLKKYEYLL